MPCDAAKATVASLPKTRAATWFTDSHSTGLTLPGMIDEPACSSGSSSSAEAGRRPAGEQADVVGDLRQRHGEAPQPGRRIGQRALPALVDHRVGRRPQRESGLRGEGGDHRRGERRRGVDAGADRGAAERQLAQRSTSACDRASARPASRPSASASWPSVTGVASIRCVRPALTTPANRSASAAEGVDQAVDRRVDVVDELAGDGDPDRRRHRVVRRLRRVDVVVGVHGRAERRRRQVGEHLVDVHVGRRAGSGLEDIDGELLVEFAGLDAPAAAAMASASRRRRRGRRARRSRPRRAA